MGPKTFDEGREGFVRFREEGWEKVVSREHVVEGVYPKLQEGSEQGQGKAEGEGEDFELMLRGTVDYGLKDGSKGRAEWAGHMVLKYLKEEGGYKLAFYQVWIVSRSLLVDVERFWYG